MRCPGGALQDSRPSRPATLSIGNGVLIDITSEPIDAHVQEGDSATFSVSATSNLPLSYQWWTALPGSATFNFLQPTRWGFSGRPGQLLESCVHWGRKGGDGTLGRSIFQREEESSRRSECFGRGGRNGITPLHGVDHSRTSDRHHGWYTDLFWNFRRTTCRLSLLHRIHWE
jgi:hypothetical protein